jgi:hypothetical protein
LDLDFSAWLVPEGSAEKISLPVEILHYAGGEDKPARFLQFELPPLQAGRYGLHIRADDPAKKVEAETSSELRIK